MSLYLHGMMKSLLALSSILALCVVSSCKKEVEVFNKDTETTRLQGTWEVRTFYGSYYVNDTLVHDTTIGAPFKNKAYNDYTEITFGDDSAVFLLANGAKYKRIYKLDGNKIAINYFDTLRYILSESNLKITRVDLSDGPNFAAHRDTLHFILKRK